MASHLDMQDFAVAMTDRKENIEGLEPEYPSGEGRGMMAFKLRR